MDEFQQIWETHSDTVTNAGLENEESLESKLIAQSSNIFHKINRTMMLDATLMAITTLLFIAVTFMIDLEKRYLVSSILLGVMVLLGIHYWAKRKYISNRDFINNNILTSLSQKLDYLKRNSLVYILGIPIMTVCFCFYLVNVDTQNYTLHDYGLFAQVILVVSLFAITYLFSKWLYSKLYGKEIEALKKVIKELNH